MLFGSLAMRQKSNHIFSSAMSLPNILLLVLLATLESQTESVFHPNMLENQQHVYSDLVPSASFKVRRKRETEKLFQPEPPTLELTKNGVLSSWEVPEHLRGSRDHVMVLQLLNSSTIEADNAEEAEVKEEEGYGASHPWGELTKEIVDAGPDNVISVLIPVSKFLSGEVTMVRLAVRDIDYELSKTSTLVRLRDIKIKEMKKEKKGKRNQKKKKIQKHLNKT